MARLPDRDSKTPPDNSRPQPFRTVDPRVAAFYNYYFDPLSPAYANGTKAAELAGYKGEPGSNQLAVQAHRLLHRPNRCLTEALLAAGCTPQLIGKTVREALDAEQIKYLRGANNEIIPTPAQPDHRTRLKAVEAICRVFRDAPNSEAPGTLGKTTDPPPKGEAVSPEQAEAIERVARLDAVDRVLLRDVCDCDAKLANPEESGQPKE